MTDGTEASSSSTSGPGGTVRNTSGNPSISTMRQQFLPAQGEPPLKWPIWFQMYEDHLLLNGLDTGAEARKLAFLRSSLGTEG